jgi:hypothetical protein
VTASAGRASVGFTPNSIGDVAPSLSWGSLTTQVQAMSPTITKTFHGVTVTDSTKATYEPNSAAPWEATGIVGVAGVSVGLWELFNQGGQCIFTGAC